jgi:hypothetical protein
MVGFVGTQAKVLREQGGVSHCGLAIYIKKYHNANEELWKFKYFTMQKILIFKKTLYKKKTKILQDVVKHCLEFFLLIFSSLMCLKKKPVFRKRDLLQWKGSTSETLLGSSDQRKAPASLSLFLKSEKIPALLSVGKGL